MPCDRRHAQRNCRIGETNDGVLSSENPMVHWCGEANYSWVTRATYEFDEFDEEPSKSKIVRMAKKFAGLTGQLCEVEDVGDKMIIRPMYANAPCVICFVRFDYEV